MPTIINRKQAARMSGINPGTMKRLCQDGRVPGCSQPRGEGTHYEIDLDAFLEGIIAGDLREYRKETMTVPVYIQREVFEVPARQNVIPFAAVGAGDSAATSAARPHPVETCDCDICRSVRGERPRWPIAEAILGFVFVCALVGLLIPFVR